MKLRTLGGLSLEPSPYHRWKTLTLLAYLAVEGPRPRHHLRELFWPSASDPASSLRVVLGQVRAAAPHALREEGGRLGLGLPSDVADLLAGMRDDPGRVPALYTGAFLDGVTFPDCGAELEEWMYTTREALGSRVRGHLLDLAEEGRGHSAAAGRLAEQALRVPGAPEPGPAELGRLHRLLARSPLAAEIRRAAAAGGVMLPPVDGAAPRPALPVPADRGMGVPSGFRTPFVGRRRERALICRALESGDSPLITILGPGGMGKTRLALEVLWDFGGRSPAADGGHFVSLEAVDTVDGLLGALAAALGVSPSSGRTVPVIADAIGAGRVLLVLDNFEQVTDGAPVLSEVLGRCPNLRLLVTSRQPLGLRQETVLPLGGLALPDARNEAAPGEAVELFVHAARRARLDFELHPDDTADLYRVVGMTGGLPLAIELAAAWSRMLSPGQIAREMTRGQGEVFSSTLRDLPERHRTLRAVFDSSWALLTGDEQRVLRQLSVFGGGFTREAAVEVAGATLPVLHALVDKSVLRVDGRGRFDEHLLLHEYTARRLAEHPAEEADARERHTAFFLALAAPANVGLRGPGRMGWIARLSAEQRNFRAVLGRLVAGSQWDRLAELASRLELFWSTQGLSAEGLRWLGAVPPEVLDGDVRGLRVLGGLAATTGDSRRGRQALTRALELLHGRPQPPSVRDRAAEAYIHLHLTHVELRTGNLHATLRHAEVARQLYHDSGDTYLEGLVLGILGTVLTNTGDLPRARSTLERAVRLSGQAGNAAGLIVPLHALAEFHVAAGGWDEAEEHFLEVVRLAREFQDPAWHASALIRLGELALLRTEPRRARDHLRGAMDLMLRAHNRGNMLRTIDAAGHVALLHGRPGRAAHLWSAADAAHGHFGLRLEPLPQTLLDGHLGRTRAEMGDEAFGLAWSDGQALTWEGMVALAREELAGGPAVSFTG